MSDFKPTPEQIAAQLRQPFGEFGIAMGDEMNKGNDLISKRTYNHLNLNDGERLLEIGMGNGYFIPHLLSMAANLHYTGLDYSTTMVEAATEKNRALIAQQQVKILEGNVTSMPFEDNSFDKICTVNTLYFWPTPAADASELLRVLKPGGKIVLGIRPKSILENMEIAKTGFVHYSPEEAVDLLKAGGFREVDFSIQEEPQKEFNGHVYNLEGCYVTGTK